MDEELLTRDAGDLVGLGTVDNEEELRPGELA